MQYSNPMSRDRLDAFLARDREHVAGAARSFALLHDRPVERAALLIHGLTASPGQFADVAAGLHERGYNVFVPRLPRHGHSDRMTQALATLTSEALLAASAESLAIARDLAPKVVVAGFSLGGLLAAHIAQHEQVERVVPIAPFLGVAWLPIRFASRTFEWLLTVPNYFAWWNPLRREKLMPAHGYPRYSTHALAHAYRIAHRLFADAHVRAPHARRIVMITNAREAAVNNRAARRLAAMWREHGGSVEHVVLSDLPISHDIVEPLANSRLAKRVLPRLLAAIDG